MDRWGKGETHKSSAICTSAFVTASRQRRVRTILAASQQREVSTLVSAKLCFVVIKQTPTSPPWSFTGHQSRSCQWRRHNGGHRQEAMTAKANTKSMWSSTDCIGVDIITKDGAPLARRLGSTQGFVWRLVSLSLGGHSDQARTAFVPDLHGEALGVVGG